MISARESLVETLCREGEIDQVLYDIDIYREQINSIGLHRLIAITEVMALLERVGEKGLQKIYDRVQRGKN